MSVCFMQFYVAESSLELLARHMLFLTLASEPLDQLGLQGHTHNHMRVTHARHKQSRNLIYKINTCNHRQVSRQQVGLHWLIIR